MRRKWKGQLVAIVWRKWCLKRIFLEKHFRNRQVARLQCVEWRTGIRSSLNVLYSFSFDLVRNVRPKRDLHVIFEVRSFSVLFYNVYRAKMSGKTNLLYFFFNVLRILTTQKEIPRHSMDSCNCMNAQTLWEDTLWNWLLRSNHTWDFILKLIQVNRALLPWGSA